MATVTLSADATFPLGTHVLSLVADVTMLDEAPPEITTTALPAGAVGVAYSFTPAVVGTVSLTWSATGLPPGLSINSATGRISGTPSAAGLFNAAVTASSAEFGADTLNTTLTIAETQPGVWVPRVRGSGAWGPR